MINESSKSDKNDAPDEAMAGNGWQLVNFDVLKNPPTVLAAPIYAVAILFVLAVLVMAGFGLFASFQIAYETLTGSFEHRIEAAKVFFPILLALVGGPLLIWRVITAHIQAQAARHQADTGREAHYTSLFTKAVEQLGATREAKQTIEVGEGEGSKKRETIMKTEPNLEVRLGAIYALERIAQDSERDHWSIMEVLCAYVRNPQNCGTPPMRPEKLLVGTPEHMKWVATLEPHVDVQAAVYAVGRRRPQRLKDGRRLDFSRMALQDTTLFNFNFERAIFRRSNLEAISFNESALAGVIFIESELSVVIFDKTDLRGAFFNNAKIQSGFFDNVDLSNSWFDSAHLRKVHFTKATLNSAIFDGALFFDGGFSESNMTRASLNDTVLLRVNFLGAQLMGTTFFDTDLSHVYGLTSEQLAAALGDASTTLPDQLIRPPTWPTRKLSWEEREEFIRVARDGV